MSLLRKAIEPLTLPGAAARKRDGGDWAAAAALYSRLLDRVGRNAMTYRYVVQLGNCLKEAGCYDEALAAYDDAVKIRGRSADLNLQRGHLYKLMGNSPAAAWAYQHAYNLDPGNEDARAELERSGAPVAAGVVLPETQVLRTIWFDVTDFVNYARENASLSGIQRVCGALVRSAVRMRMTGYRVVPVIPDYDSGQFYAVGYDSFVQLARLFDRPVVDRDDVAKGIAAVEATKCLAIPAADDILVVAGAFWIVPSYDFIAALRRRGVKFGLFIHDLIALRHPKYAMPEVVAQFTEALSEATELCDFVLTNSQYVAGDVRAYLRDTKQRDVPVTALPLPTGLPVRHEPIARDDADDPTLRTIFVRDYVLVVSTIEVRKNHALLIRVWERLREELGEQTPRLVFVGKWGWQVDALEAYVAEQGYEDDWLHILESASDAVLSGLYRSALFTVYPSFAEGFGLPIGESLAQGTPCIASNTTAMPEVGGDLVRYFDPFDREAALAAIRQPIVDRADLERWRSRMAAEFEPRPWSAFCTHFYRQVIASAEAAPDRATG